MSLRIMQRIFSFMLVAGMLMGFVAPTGAQPSQSQASKPPTVSADKVEDLVFGEIEASGQTDFFVWMTTTADLSSAESLRSKEAKGRYVFETVRATAEQSQMELRSYLDIVGATYQPYYIVNAVFVQGGNLDLVLQLAARPDVSAITANHKYQLEVPFRGESQNLSPDAIEANVTFINADDAWAMGAMGQGTVMAGNDTGLDETHPAIAPHYRGCLNPPTCSSWDHNYNWWDATDAYPTNPYDGHGHGTHTTGTMVGDDLDAGTNQIGVAPGAQTVHCKNMTDGGSGSDATFLECFQWDLAPWDLSGANPDSSKAPDAVNNSWGYGGGGINTFRSAILTLQLAGIAVEVSAGNEGPSCYTLRSPGDYSEVLTTGSVDHNVPYPGIITVSSWSTSRGPSDLDGNYFPDVMAPGNTIRSSLPGNTYASWSGTSMAGPHATALIGLIWSACPAMQGMVYETFDLIKDTAEPLAGQEGSSCGGDYTVGPNNDWGYGTINAQAAVQTAIGMCSGMGSIEGYVTDAFSTDPIQDAHVVMDWSGGGSWEKDTDENGYFLQDLPIGFYDVSVSHPMYEAAEISGVEVVTDTVTPLDIELTPRGLLIGYVTDADNGFPLEDATVEADDGTTTITDSDGYYSMYLDQGTHSITASADDYAPESADVVMVSGTITQQDFALYAAIAFTPSPAEITLDWGTTGTLPASLINRLPAPYDFEFMEAPGGFDPALAARTNYDLVPSIPADVTTGLAPEASVPVAPVRGGLPSGAWESLTSTPFATMDQVYVDFEGKGYLVGGYGGGGKVGIYDPDTDSWSLGATEPTPQIAYVVDACVGLNDSGEGVIVMFNDASSGATTLHRYNIATNSWDTPAVPTGFPANGLWAPDIASLLRFSGQNVCYISGGATAPGGGNTSALYEYHPDTNTVVNLGNFNYIATGMAFHASWYVPWIGASGAVCAAGGVNSSSTVSSATQCYDIAAGTFNAANADLGALPAGLWGMAEDVLYEGGDYQLWVANGADSAFALWPNSAYYSESDGAWYIGPNPPTTVYRVEGTNIASADGCSFYVGAGSLGGFTPSSGHNRNFSDECPPTAGVDVPWLGEDPVTGSVPAEDELPVTLLFTATVGAGVTQPGDYTANLKVAGNPSKNVPVKMTVLPAANMGKVTGMIWDNCQDDPLEEVLVSIVGGDPITMTYSAEDGGYTAWLVEGSYTLQFSLADYLTIEADVMITAGQTSLLDVALVPDRPCMATDPDNIEAWVSQNVAEYIFEGGFDITNNGGQDLSFEVWELPALATDGGIASLSGTYVTFDPSIGGDDSYMPGTDQTFCFRAESYTNDWEYVYTIWERFPDNWTVNDAYVAGTPTCDSGSWGSFTWEFENAPNEIQINHARYMSPTDHCVAYYCVDVTSGAGMNAPVSWFWDGDGYGSTPHWPCSSDGYAPSGFTCDEAINPPAEIPVGFVDSPWFWTSPISGTVPAGSSFNMDIFFSSISNTVPLPLGDYEMTMLVDSNDPENDEAFVPVMMHVVAEYVAPQASFEVDPTVCEDVELAFTNTTVEGVPPMTDYLWDFDDGTTSTDENPVHTYADGGTYTVVLEACNAAGCTQHSQVVEVTPNPEASFTFDANWLEVTFTNTSLNGDTYLWDFDDGTTSTEVSPVHVYSAPGTYNVTLTVYNGCGMDVYELIITVEACPVPEASFTFEADFLEVTFTNTSVNGVSYEWDFGDGEFSVDVNPVHVYAEAGTYTVILTVIGECDIVTFEAIITVEQGVYYVVLPIQYKP